MGPRSTDVRREAYSRSQRVSSLLARPGLSGTEYLCRLYLRARGICGSFFSETRQALSCPVMNGGPFAASCSDVYEQRTFFFFVCALYVLPAKVKIRVSCRVRWTRLHDPRKLTRRSAHPCGVAFTQGALQCIPRWSAHACSGKVGTQGERARIRRLAAD